MDIKKYFSEQPTVEIRVVKVSGKKITKSILNQIPSESSFSIRFDFRNVKIIGYVNEGVEWIVYTREDQLRKADLTLLKQTIECPMTVDSAFTFTDIKLDGDESYYWEGSYTQLPKEMQEKFIAIKDQSKLYYTILRNHQIYI